MKFFKALSTGASLAAAMPYGVPKQVETNSNKEVWTQKTSYPGPARHHPVTFGNGTHGFVIGGSTWPSSKTDSVYAYDPTSDSWTEMGKFPGKSRGYAYGEILGNVAFVGFGANGRQYFNDLWRYDTVNDLWSKLSPCPCQGRSHPAFVIATHRKNDQIRPSIYVGLGNGKGGNYNDFWRYDIHADSWSQLPDFPSSERHHPYHFSLPRANAFEKDVVAGLGHSRRGIERDFYKFDTVAESWNSGWNFTAIGQNGEVVSTEARVAGTEFNACGKGFVLSGDGDNHGPMQTGEFFAFDASSGTFSQLPAHPGYSRWAPGSFVVDEKVYFTSGYDRATRKLHNDVWQFDLRAANVCS